MKNLILLALLASNSVLAAEMDYQLYMRTSAGTNSSGGKQILLTNPGSSGNEFRLGNESTYAEVSFIGHALKPADKGSPFFDATMTFVYNPQMNSQYGDTTRNTDYTQVVQAFISGGQMPDIPYTLWAGKRFYRDVDAYMDDFFYFADMSGVGAGADAIKMSNGHLAVAYLQRADNNFQNATNGMPAKQALDVRWRNIELSSSNSLHLWAAGAYSAPGNGTYVDPATSTSSAVTYQAASGVAGGVRWRHNFESKNSYGDLAFTVGNGNMATLTLDSAPAFAKTGVYDPGAYRHRLVYSLTKEFGEHFVLEGVIVEEESNSGKDVDPIGRWSSIGVRPHYRMSEHVWLTAEAGYSDIEMQSERDSSGGRAGRRTLTRITVAPEVIVASMFNARPILRAYVTHTAWNAANADTANASGLIGKLNSNNITALNGERDETQFGFQGEVWF